MSVVPAAKRLAFQAVRFLSRARSHGDKANCLLVVQAILPLGGCVHATPLFSQLRRTLPELPPWVATRGLGLQLLRHNPHIGGLLEISNPADGFVPAVRNLRSALRQHQLRPAWTLLDVGNTRSKIALFGVLAGRAPLAGYSEADGLLTIHLHADPNTRSLLEDNLRIGTAIGADCQHSEPKVYISAGVATHARELLHAVNPAGLPVVIFATEPSGGQPTKWRDDRFVRVVEHTAARGMLPIFVGTADQAPAIDALRGAAAAPTVSLAGKTDIRVLAAVLALADLCISIDTGTMHVARASRVPLVVLGPIFQSPLEWLPLSVSNARVLRGEGIHPVTSGYRLDEIEVAQVTATVDEVLVTYPPSEAARNARLTALITDVDHLASDRPPGPAA